MVIKVVGYGSLLSARSARETIPSLKDFKLVTVANYKRVFNKVGIVFFQRYKVSAEDKEISSCSTRQAPGVIMICSLFSCTEDDFANIYEREHRFRWTNVECLSERGTEVGRMCTENDDENYLLNKCVTPSEYYRRVGQFYCGRIWRDDILPFPIYLRHCLDAARQHGEHVYRNFIETSFLADGTTSIRAYLENKPDLVASANTPYTYAPKLVQQVAAD
jgi:hypothetical protein